MGNRAPDVDAHLSTGADQQRVGRKDKRPVGVVGNEVKCSNRVLPARRMNADAVARAGREQKVVPSAEFESVRDFRMKEAADWCRERRQVFPVNQVPGAQMSDGRTRVLVAPLPQAIANHRVVKDVLLTVRDARVTPVDSGKLR